MNFVKSYVAMEANFSRVGSRMPWPAVRKRRQFGRLECPQVVVNHPEGTEEPGESTLPKCI